MPYLAAGAVAFVGGLAHDKKLPAETTRVVIGTVALVIVASASDGTALGPLVHAFGLLILLVAVMAAIRLNLPGNKPVTPAKGKK